MCLLDYITLLLTKFKLLESDHIQKLWVKNKFLRIYTMKKKLKKPMGMSLDIEEQPDPLAQSTFSRM